MTDLTLDASISNKLDESILDQLPSRNSKNGLSENTKKVYTTVIRDFNQFLKDNRLKVNPESVRAYFDSISGKLSPATLNQRKYALLKVIKSQFGADSVIKMMAIEKVFEAIPTYKIDNTVSDNKVLTEKQIKQMMEAAAPKTRLIINFLFKTGCRVSEMIGIRPSDCEVVSDFVRIRVTGKGRRVREVVIPKSLYDDIRETYQSTTWLFESRSGKPLNRNNIGHQIKRVGRQIGLSNVHPHMLRHTRATDLIVNKGVSTKATSLYLGHSTTSITLDMYVKDRVNVRELFDKDII